MVRGADYLGVIKMGPKTITVKDANGQNYVVNDPRRFLKHLIKQHGSGDGSVHLENGSLFDVTQSFFDDVQSKVNTLKFK